MKRSYRKRWRWVAVAGALGVVLLLAERRPAPWVPGFLRGQPYQEGMMSVGHFKSGVVTAHTRIYLMDRPAKTLWKEANEELLANRSWSYRPPQQGNLRHLYRRSGHEVMIVLPPRRGDDGSPLTMVTVRAERPANVFERIGDLWRQLTER